MKITVQVLGGESDILDLDEGSTVGDVKREMGVVGYAAAVNGEPCDDDAELSEYEFVTLSPSVKGGC